LTLGELRIIIYVIMRIILIITKMTERFTTTHRQLLLQILREAKGHLNAKQLFQEVVKREPHTSLATVYRNLRFFEELGLVDGRRLDKAHCYYEIKRSGEHYHLVCTTCGKVAEFGSPAVSRLVDEVQRNSGFAVTRVALHLQGYCPECKDKAKG
jgi:Fur family ferric uptake transcriptional regulator